MQYCGKEKKFKRVGWKSALRQILPAKSLTQYIDRRITHMET